MSAGWRCLKCRFGIFKVVCPLKVSVVGLYSDDRFPGRMIIALTDHYDHWDLVPEDLYAKFWDDVRRASKALREVTQCERVNVAILGNTWSHVHAHVIPRIPEEEPRPRSAPWSDPRPAEPLEMRHEQKLIRRLAVNLNSQ